MKPSRPSDVGHPAAERIFAVDAGLLHEVIEFVEETATAAALEARRVLHLLLAVEEGFVNICEHGALDRSASVLIRVQLAGDRLIVELVDEGEPFNPLTRDDPDVTSGLEARPLGGLGIFFLRKVIDSVTYRRENGRNVLTLEQGLAR